MIQKIKCRLGFHQWEDETGDYGVLLTTYCDSDECWTNIYETFETSFFRRLKRMR